MSGGSPAGRCLRTSKHSGGAGRDPVTLAPGSFAVLISDGVADPRPGRMASGSAGRLGGEDPRSWQG